MRRDGTAIVGGHRSIGARANRRRACPSESRVDARGARYQGTIPEVVWAKRSCRNGVRRDRMIKKHLASFIIWTLVVLMFCVTAAHGSPLWM